MAYRKSVGDHNKTPDPPPPCQAQATQPKTQRKKRTMGLLIWPRGSSGSFTPWPHGTSRGPRMVMWSPSGLERPWLSRSLIQISVLIYVRLVCTARTQGDRGAPAVKVDRAHRQCGEAQRVSRGPKRVEIAPIADERVLHITPFRSAPTNVYTSVSLHARGMMQQAAASNVSPWACCHGDTWTEPQV